MSTPNSASTNSEAPTGAALTLYDDRQQVVLHTAIELWASASTGVETRRREEQLKNKRKIVRFFFEWVRKPTGEVEPTDVRAWCDWMTKEGKSPATIYARVASLSSFYRWAMPSRQSARTYVRTRPCSPVRSGCARTRRRRRKPGRTKSCGH